MSELLREIGAKAEALCGEAYFVGGCVRDLLRGVRSKDVDLAVAGSTYQLGKALTREYGGHVFYLRQEDEVVRVLLPGLGDLQLDLCPLRGTLDQDLHARDLTINAMAVPAAAGLEAGSPIFDPTGGRSDLEAQLIRFVSPQAPVADPLRTMRAFRFRWKLDFELAEGTVQRIQECVPLLARVSVERTRDELFQLLGLDAADRALEEVLEAGTGPYLVGTRSAPFSTSPARVGEVLRLISPLAAGMPESLNDLLLSEPTPGRRRREVLLWAAALQPLQPEVAPGTACRFLALSNDEKQIVTRALGAAPEAGRLLERWPVAGRERYRLFKMAPGAGVETVLLSPGPWDDAHQELLHEAMERHLNPPKPVLTGHDVMQVLGLGPGKELGRVMEALEEARADGVIGTAEEASAWLRAGGAGPA